MTQNKIYFITTHRNFDVVFECSRLLRREFFDDVCNRHVKAAENDVLCLDAVQRASALQVADVDQVACCVVDDGDDGRVQTQTNWLSVDIQRGVVELLQQNV